MMKQHLFGSSRGTVRASMSVLFESEMNWDGYTFEFEAEGQSFWTHGDGRKLTVSWVDEDYDDPLCTYAEARAVWMVLPATVCDVQRFEVSLQSRAIARTLAGEFDEVGA